MGLWAGQTAGRAARLRDRIERWLEAERDQLPLWLPVALGGGVAAWFVLPDPARWSAWILADAAGAALALAAGRGGRAGQWLAALMLLAAAGCALAWWRAERVAAPVLARPVVARFTAEIERVEPLAARELVRLQLRVLTVAAGTGTGTGGAAPRLPPVVRVNVAEEDAPAGLARGARLRLRARLMPPPDAAVPGAYDFARVAWFAGIGATGRAFAPVEVIRPAAAPGGALRERLAAHASASAGGGGEGGIAAALVTGAQGAIPEADADAMRASGLAHLLSISGLHVTAVVGATMWLVLRLLALSPTLALAWRLPLVAAGAAAAVAVGYTLLTGAEVPTVRSCIAALLVLAALAAGREAVTLRLVAAGALVVLLLWPESLAGPSFQLSFAAVTAIVALHEHPRVRAFFMARDEGSARRIGRGLLSLLLTGLAVEAALMPIAAYHFHKAGLYGALANIVAIPLTTFAVMPAEAVALALDMVGLGAPAWWIVRVALTGLLALAHAVAAAPGSSAALPAMPDGAFALMVAGGLWLGLWRTRVRWAGLAPVLAGAACALATPPPDLVVTGDGRHLAIRTVDGMALLRDRAGDYVRDTLAEAGGSGDLPPLAEAKGARCSADLCVVRTGGWTVAATRSGYLVPWREMIATCAAADVVVSERRVPGACKPRRLLLDRPALARTGGVALWLGDGRMVTSRRPEARHPWRHPPRP